VLGGQKCVAGEARCGGRGGRIFPAPLTRWSRISSPRISLCPACSERPLWDGDGLGVPDTVSRRAERKWPLKDAAETDFWSDAPQITLGDVLGDATADALSQPNKGP
jgi:hypothetical protein